MRRTFPIFACLVTLASILGVIFGCSRTIDSPSELKEFPTAPSTPVNVTALLNAQSITLRWDVIDTSSVVRFRIYLTDSLGEQARLRDSTTGAVFSRTLSGISLNQTMYFSVATVGKSGIEGLRSFPPLRVRLSPMSIVIENGGEYTSRRNVNVQAFAGIGATNIKLSENVNLTGAEFRPISSQQGFTLSEGDGVKRIYAHFVYDDGTQTGTPVSDEITLDTRAEIDSVNFAPSSTVLSSGSSILFRVWTAESGGQGRISFPGLETPLSLYDDGVGADATADDGVYSAEFTVPISMALSNGQVTGAFTDPAGNQAPTQLAFSTLNIVTTPATPRFTLIDAISSSEISLNWSATSESDFSAYRIYRSRTRTVTSDSTLIATVTTAAVSSLLDTSLLENAWYYYRIYVFNQYGKSTASAIDSARTLVNAVPTPVVLAGNSDSSGARLSWSANIDDDFAMYRLYRSSDTTDAVDTTGQLVAIFNSREASSYDDAALLSYPALAYRVYVYDRQGKTSFSNKVIVIR